MPYDCYEEVDLPHGCVVSADLIENETKNIVSNIIKKSPKIREAVKKWISETQTSTQLLESEMSSQQLRLQQLDHDKAKLNRRLGFLLDSADSDQAKGFKEEYHRDMNALNQEATKIHEVLEGFRQQKEFLVLHG